MRAIPPSTARPIAAAALALVAAVLAPLAAPSTALAERWLRPVPGAVARPFSYARAAPFAAGAHRGADLAAPPGAPVRAACAGRVVHAGRVAGRHQVVSMSCGRRRVSYLPLDAVAVRAGAPVRAGDPIGTVAAGHRGLHLGIRREADPFGYEDPMALLPRTGEPFTPATRSKPPRSPKPRPAVPPASAAPRRVPWPVGAAPRRTPLPVADGPTPAPLAEHDRPGPAHGAEPAPLPVWVGLALLLCGVAGSGTVVVRRRHVRERTAAIRAAPGR